MKFEEIIPALREGKKVQIFLSEGEWVDVLSASLLLKHLINREFRIVKEPKKKKSKSADRIIIDNPIIIKEE